MGNVRRDEARSLPRVSQGVFKAFGEYRQEYIGHFSLEEFVFLHSRRITSQADGSDEHRNTLRNSAIGSNVPEPLAGAEVAQRIDMSFATVVDRVRMDFVEMPGMELTLPQAVRLWSLGMDDCRCVIDALVDAGFLAWTPKRTIVRKGRDPLSRQEMQTTDISVPVAKRYNKSV
jgi:hypothetical protein